MNNEVNQFINQPIDATQADSHQIPDYVYLMEELHVLQSKVANLEQDRELLYNITQEQKDRITELSNKIRNYQKTITILVYSGAILAICIMLIASYSIFK